MKAFFSALSLSLAVHALVALAAAWWLEDSSGPYDLVALDLSSVELSFAESVEESAAPTAAAAAGGGSTAEAQPRTVPREVPRPEFEPPAVELSVPIEDFTPPPPEPVNAEIVPSKMAESKNAEIKPLEMTEPEKAESEPAPTPTAAAAPRQARIDAPPRLKANIKPDYPLESRRRGEAGDVVLELEIGPDGKAAEVRVVASPGFPLLEEAAVKAVRRARFKPATANGSPVSATIRLTLNFRLK